MPHKRTTVITTVIAGLAAGAYLTWAPQSTAPTSTASDLPTTSLTTETGRYLFNVTLHTPEEIAGLLKRAEELTRTTHAEIRGTGIALVLHGPEIAIFAKKNYSQFRKTVELAARLDAERIIEVKMCRTEMKILGIREEDVPDFIELVPYGPDEETRLRSNGYVYL